MKFIEIEKVDKRLVQKFIFDTTGTSSFAKASGNKKALIQNKATAGKFITP